MTRWECNTCPFTTSDEDEARGHGYQPDGSLHSLSLIVEPEPYGLLDQALDRRANEREGTR